MKKTKINWMNVVVYGIIAIVAIASLKAVITYLIK